MTTFHQNIIKRKTELLNLAAALGNIAQACGIMEFSRDTFYSHLATMKQRLVALEKIR